MLYILFCQSGDNITCMFIIPIKHYKEKKTKQKQINGKAIVKI